MADPDAPRPDTPKTPAQARRAADAEHALALAQLDAWCGAVEAAHRQQPAQGELVWRLATCHRLRGQSVTAEQVLEAARSKAGARALETARTALDRRIGAPPSSSDELDRTWASACEHFATSLSLDASPTAQLAVAACQLSTGQLQSAKALVAAATTTVEPLAATDEYRAQQLSLARWLDGEIDRVQPRVRVVAGASYRGEISLDAERLRPGSESSIEPGTHTLRAEVSGRAQTHQLDARGGQTWRVEIEPPARRLGSSRRIALWSLAGVGAASAITSGVMFAVGQNRWDELAALGCSRSSRFGGQVDCPTTVPEEQPRAYLRAIDLFHGTAAGALLLGTSALVVYLTAPRAERLVVTPQLRAGGAGVSASVRF